MAAQLLGPNKARPELKEEIRQCLRNVKEALEEAGSGMNKVLKVLEMITVCLLLN